MNDFGSLFDLMSWDRRTASLLRDPHFAISVGRAGLFCLGGGGGGGGSGFAFEVSASLCYLHFSIIAVRNFKVIEARREGL